MATHTVRRARWPRILGATLFPLFILVLALAWLAGGDAASTRGTGGVVAAQGVVLASSDLAGMPSETIALLDDPALIERVTEQALRPTRGKAVPNTDPWHNVLYVLLSLESKPTPLVLAWTRPALRITPEQAVLTPVRLRAVRVLASVDDVATAATLLDFLAADPAE